MTKSKLFLGIVALGFVLSLALAQPKDLPEEISAYLEAWQATERFMGAVLVAKGGTVVFEEDYGLADLETGRPNTPHTTFRLGSLSKPLTATAVLQLQEAGHLTLDDAVGAHLPEYPNGRIITLRHLLTHTSGIPDYARFPDYPSYMNSPTTLSGLIDRFKNLPLMFPPGTQFGYSNSNYVLLTAIVEQVSGQDYGTYLQEHVFAPSLMDSSGYGEASLSPAKGYRLSDDGYVPASRSTFP